MKSIKYVILGALLAIALALQAPAPQGVFAQDAAGQAKPLLVTVFHMPTCKACQKAISDIIPSIAEKYGDRVNWSYVDIAIESNYKRFLELEKETGRHLSTPTILIGKIVLVGVTEAADSLDKTIKSALASRSFESFALEGRGIDLLERFRSFGPLAIVGAGIVDGINPCAFTVIVFFVSFLSVMGYRRREMALIGIFYIAAVFFTYLALGLGFFKAFYSLKGFYLVSKFIYLLIGSFSLYFGGLAVKDYIIYKRTGNTDGMALQLPRVIKNKIHAIVGAYYRKDKAAGKKAVLGLIFSALAVGFMVSLLEAVCTGQLYLPTIVFVLKEASLRARALFYLVIYNLMFILPLVLVLLLALFGVSSKQFESYARKHLGLVKLLMAAVFLALGIVLLRGLF
jgi:glutaredoxin